MFSNSLTGRDAQACKANFQKKYYKTLIIYNQLPPQTRSYVHLKLPVSVYLLEECGKTAGDALEAKPVVAAVVPGNAEKYQR